MLSKTNKPGSLTYQTVSGINEKGLQEIPQKKLSQIKFKAIKMVNWKTSILGLAVMLITFLESVNILPAGIGKVISGFLTGLLGYFAADGSNVK